MRVSYDWIKEFADFKLSPKEAAEKLTALGVEVSEVVYAGALASGCVVGRIKKIWKHPEADKLNLTEVSTQEGTFEIVCGAGNLKLEAFVIVALEGARLPGDVVIKKTKIRGVESNGMLCSKKELGLPYDDSDDGIYLLPEGTDLQTPIASFLGKEEAFFELEVTTNRSDCLSVQGLVRELSVIAKTPLRARESFAFKNQDGSMDAVVLDARFCPRYTLRTIKNIRVEPSEEKIRKRLEDHGVRSVNNVVDALNYATLLLGQPLHAFDLDKIEGAKIYVRRAKEGERLMILGGRELVLTAEDFVIADEAKALALAGVIGGLDSSVSKTTKNLALESAYFEPKAVRAMARRHKIFTDAASRFQRSVNVEALPYASDYVVNHFRERSPHSGMYISGFLKDVYTEKMKPRSIVLSYRLISDILGVELDMKSVIQNLQLLGFDLAQSDKDKLKLTAPMHRYHDVKSEVDVVEEVARTYGYDAIPRHAFMAKNASLLPKCVFDQEFSEILVSLGYFQLESHSFVEDDFYKSSFENLSFAEVLDPIAESVLRPDLFFGLLKAVLKNESRFDRRPHRLFEIGKVFSKKEDGDFSEEKLLCFLLRGKEKNTWYAEGAELDFYDLKGDLERIFESAGVLHLDYEPLEGHPWLHEKASAKVVAMGKVMGAMGLIRPELLSKLGLSGSTPAFGASLSVDLLPKPSEAKVKIKALSPYPSIFRDLAFVAPKNFPIKELTRRMKAFSPKIKSVHLSGLYEGDKIEAGKRSIVFSLEYNSLEGTLRKEEVDEEEKKLIATLERDFSIKLR